MEYDALMEQARKAKDFSYSPYSHFRVGAALLCADGSIYTGCNIENAAYTPTNCAERTAFFKAVSEGKRQFSAIAISGDTKEYLPPCGVCRQVMAEFVQPDTFEIVMEREGGNLKIMKLSELFPSSFLPEHLEK